MAYQTEEEQVEALKKWWRESGTSILAGVVLAIGGIFGWQAWQQHQLEERIAASRVYQQLAEAWSEIIEPGPETKNVATFQHLAGVLKEEHPDSVYALLGTLQLARLQVEVGELEQARQELDWVLAQDPPVQLAELARVRLAQVLLAQEKYQETLALLDAHEPVALQAEWLELRGDVLRRMERPSDALAAYRKASAASFAAGQHRPLLDLKLDDMAAEAEES